MSTDTAETTTFAGRTVEGEIPRYNDRAAVEQRPIEEFVAALDALLAFDEVAAVRWRQYTPYFNDGEPCNFSTYGASIKLVGALAKGADDEDDEEAGFEDLYLGYPAGYWDTHDWHGRGGKAKPVESDKVLQFFGGDPREPSAELSAAAAAFEHVLESGGHYTQLNKVFGDPAEVTATTEGFSVEYYDHD